MNSPKNYHNTKKRFTIPLKKPKSSNRILSKNYPFPSLKLAINIPNKFFNSPYLEIINHGKKKNNRQIFNPLNNHKPYSGNPLKLHMKKEFNSINGLIKTHPERDILTAVGQNFVKKKNIKKNNIGIIGMNQLNIKQVMFPSLNINNHNIINNKKLWNFNNIIKHNNKLINNYYNNKKNYLFDSDDKKNNINKEIKLNTLIKHQIINANIKNNINDKSEDMKKTITERDILTSNKKEKEEIFPLEKHFDLCFVSYAYSENANLEHRKDMEDFHYIKALLNSKNNCSYFGLFDGHSGKEVGMYLMQNLHKTLSQELKNSINLDNSENIKNAVINSFEKTDKEINNKGFQKESGSTGTVLLLYKDINSSSGKSFLCANVGDSKAYLITKKEMKLITIDHNCNNPNEVKRIRDNGGIVFRGRVFGTLMLTRSFGDKEMKKYGVLSTPDIFIKNIDEEDIFIIMASDGVWDIVEENEIFQMSKEKISSSDFSKKIVNLAKERDTHDNISCIVIKLNKGN